ncbi:MAG: RluA family pseudouridine synthase [Clostridia bacterium]|nr:RluA family pseudouridine synthase [Clostridia bacterium]
MNSFISEKNGKLSKLALIYLSDLSYSALRSALRKKDVKINGVRTDKDVALCVGDKVEIYYKPIETKGYSVVFADENVLVVNKKSGFTSESVYQSILNENENAFFIHRLDRNTSGLMIFALNDVAEKELLFGFKNRTFDKLYKARVKGMPEPKKAVLTAYLFKDQKNSLVTVTDKKVVGSTQIITGYEVVSVSDSYSDLIVTLYTGKTHQIRAHLAHIGNPILGDGKYGDFALNNKLKLKRQLLTAVSLTLKFEKDSPLYYLNGKTFTVDSEF